MSGNVKIPSYWEKRIKSCEALPYDKRVDRVWQELGVLMTTTEKARAIEILRELMGSGKLLDSQVGK